MPVKKSKNKKENEGSEKKKRSSKKVNSSRKKVTREEKESIKKAVDSLSGLVIKQVPVEKPVPTSSSAPSVQAAQMFSAMRELKIPAKKSHSFENFYNPHLEKKKRALLWIVVGTIMLFIMGLWIINLRTQVSDAGFSLGTEERLWQTAKEDFENFVTEPRKLLEEATKKEEVNTEEIKQVLAQNLILINQDTTSTSSTISSTSSTITTATSTPNFPINTTSTRKTTTTTLDDEIN